MEIRACLFDVLAEGLARLKRKYIIAPCSNGNIALMVNLGDLAPDPACVDIAARSFVDLAAKLGC